MPPDLARPEKFDPKANHFLARLGQNDYEALMSQAKVVTLKFRKRLIEQDQAADAVYFPVTSMISLLVTNNDAPQVELATIGREGVVSGIEAMQGYPSMGLGLIQIPGAAVRIETAAFKNIVSTRPHVQRLVHHHMYALVRQILYGAACNRMHTMGERCARWLLMTHDRAGEDAFPITQEFLSHMLGVRRATVNLATTTLKKAGFIRYVRGRMTILDRRGLESAACGCYDAIRKAYAPLDPKTP